MMSRVYSALRPEKVRMEGENELTSGVLNQSQDKNTSKTCRRCKVPVDRRNKAKYRAHDQ